MIALMGLFSYLYLYGIHPEVWIAAPPLLQTAGVLALAAAAVFCAWLSRRLLATHPKGEFPGQLPWLAAALGAALAAAALWLDWTGWQGAGLDPVASGQGATVFALLAYQGCGVAIGWVMALYLSYRSGRGLLTTPTSVTLDTVARFIGYIGLQGAAFALVLRLVPG
jgi:cytochrome c oxidase subunit I+III